MDMHEITCTDQIKDVEMAWLTLQENSLSTAYQNFDWVRSWSKHVVNNDSNSLKTVFITVYDAGKPVALFPMCIRTKKGVRILSWLADEHFNYQGGLYDRRFLEELDEKSFLSIWSQIEGFLPTYHVLWLTNQTLLVSGIQSPFRWIGQHPSANSGHQLVFEHHDWDELLKELRSKSTRKRMRNEESRLSREGNLSWKKVDREDKLEHYLDELFRQREERFKLLGIELEDHIESYKGFYLELLKKSLSETNSQINSQVNLNKKPFVYMMIIELDDIILATMLLAEKDSKLYPLINSMTSSEFHKWSPGDYLLRLVIQDACKKESTLIDFGLSEDNNYKTVWCNTKVEMFETIKGRSLVGKPASFLINNGIAVKRKIKQSPRLWSWYCSVRAGKLWKKT